MNYLVSEDIEDELSGCIQFVEEFQNRYGDMRPEFFLGTLDQAIKLACFKPAKDVSIIFFFYNLLPKVMYNTNIIILIIFIKYINMFILETSISCILTS